MSAGQRRRAIVYVDGFNLYYGSLKNTPYRWLDLVTLSELMLPSHELLEVKYFTAIVDSPEGSARQQLYISALESRGRFSTCRGHFLSHVKRKRRADICQQCGERHAAVFVTEEKGTDVNLATHLVYDACTDAFDVAAVISNDSDLVMPIQFAREKCSKIVGVINPQQHPARALMETADFYKKLRTGVLQASQLPDIVESSSRRFVKPRTW
ncbi:MAG: NYN domain-containing protein [Coriobacteriia bacterium]|nr:NYN domain-containing protein [Coriobacteriia bacterium]